MKNIRTLLTAVIALTSVISANAQNINQDPALSVTDPKCLLVAPVANDTATASVKESFAVTDFSGMRSDNNVILTWSTEAGFGAAKFIVEKSNDGSNWQTLATVAVSETANTSCVYYYGDTKPFATSYYRLKPVNNDGAGDYLTVLQVKNNAKTKKNKK